MLAPRHVDSKNNFRISPMGLHPARQTAELRSELLCHLIHGYIMGNHHLYTFIPLPLGRPN